VEDTVVNNQTIQNVVDYQVSYVLTAPDQLLTDASLSGAFSTLGGTGVVSVSEFLSNASNGATIGSLGIGNLSNASDTITFPTAVSSIHVSMDILLIGGSRGASVSSINQGFTSAKTPILILPGIAGTFPLPGDGNMTYWLTHRGVAPDQLEIDPLEHVYDGLIETLTNAGYRPNEDLFVANYDWRVAPGPDDGTQDGHISGPTAQALVSDVANDHYSNGLDYLAYWMKTAADIWAGNHNRDQLGEVDVIAHSTGGLVARSYIQSDAYNDVYGQDDQGNDLRLPKIDNFIMLAVPHQGASKAWNPLHDDFAFDIPYQVLSKFFRQALLKVTRQGYTITGPDRNITLVDLEAQNQFGQTFIDTTKFISLYVPTIGSLLATYDFLDVPGNGMPTNVNSDPEYRNALLLDLNSGIDRNAWAGDVGQVIDIYGDGVDTPVTVTERTATLQDPGDPQFSFLGVWYNALANPGGIYYHENIRPTGDGTVPDWSSEIVDSRVANYAFSNQALSVVVPDTTNIVTPADVDHTGIVTNTDVEKTILKTLGIDPANVRISPLHKSLTLTTGRAFYTLINDPVESILTDADGNRLGYSQVTGVLTEIPNSFYLGGADGIGFIFGPVATPLKLDLNGLGEDYFVEVNDSEGGPDSSFTASGYLGAGEHASFDELLVPSTVATQTALQSSLDSATYGDSLTFTAVVSVASGEGTPTGTVQFRIDGTNFGNPVSLVNRLATSDIVTALGAGQHTVLAVYSGDTAFSGSTSSELAQSVSQAQLRIKADDQTKAYGQPNPSFTVSYLGFVAGQGATDLGGALNFDTTATTASHVLPGGYLITPSGLTSPNYAVAFVPGTLTITSAPLTLTVDDKTKVYGAELPAFTASYNGFVNGDDATRLSGRLTYSTTATATSNAGLYFVSASGQTSSDYTISYVPGTLMVDPQTNVQDFYTGLYLSTTASATSHTATLTLSATVKDLTPSTNVGSVATSTVTFALTNSADGSAPNIVSGSLSSLPVALVSPADPKTGTATSTVTIDMGAADTQQFKIAILVGGNYSDANRSIDDMPTITKPQPGSTTGGGYLIVERTAGLIGGDAGGKSNFTFEAKTKNGLTTGQENYIVRYQGRVYQYGTMSVSSLSVKSTTASFAGTGTIQDVTDPAKPILLYSGVTSQTSLADNGEPGSSDTFGIIIRLQDGTLWHASNWNGSQMVQQFLGTGHGGGNNQARPALEVAGVPSIGLATTTPLRLEMLRPIAAEAVGRWRAAGISAGSLGSLEHVTFKIDVLPVGDLGDAMPGVITLDRNGGGFGWFIDPTPADDSEFRSGALCGPAQGRIDLLSVVAHEMGHLLGFGHDDGSDVMLEALEAGVRHVPVPKPMVAATVMLTTKTTASLSAEPLFGPWVGLDSSVLDDLALAQMTPAGPSPGRRLRK
jgi:hypothetical protein